MTSPSRLNGSTLSRPNQCSALSGYEDPRPDVTDLTRGPGAVADMTCMMNSVPRVAAPDRRPCGRDGGFTLLELIAAIAILGITTIALLPAYLDLRSSARTAMIQDTVRSVTTWLDGARAIALVKEASSVSLPDGTTLSMTPAYRVTAASLFDAAGAALNQPCTGSSPSKMCGPWRIDYWPSGAVPQAPLGMVQITYYSGSTPLWQCRVLYMPQYYTNENGYLSGDTTGC